jgi:hypothetical protein
MRIGHSVPRANNTRTDFWVTFIAANYGEAALINRFDGPEQDANVLTKAKLAYETRIKELGSSKMEDLRKDAYALWEAHFGTIAMDPTVDKTNNKRRQSTLAEQSEPKRQKTSSSGPVITTEATEDVEQMSDEKLLSSFYAFDKDFTDYGYHRIAFYIQRKFKLGASPPIRMLARIRNKAKSYAMDIPELIWGDVEYQKWMAEAPRANEAEEKVADILKEAAEAISKLNDQAQRVREMCEQFRARRPSNCDGK